MSAWYWSFFYCSAFSLNSEAALTAIGFTDNLDEAFDDAVVGPSIAAELVASAWATIAALASS